MAERTVLVPQLSIAGGRKLRRNPTPVFAHAFVRATRLLNLNASPAYELLERWAKDVCTQPSQPRCHPKHANSAQAREKAGMRRHARCEMKGRPFLGPALEGESRRVLFPAAKFLSFQANLREPQGVSVHLGETVGRAAELGLEGNDARPSERLRPSTFGQAIDMIHAVKGLFRLILSTSVALVAELVGDQCCIQCCRKCWIRGGDEMDD